MLAHSHRSYKKLLINSVVQIVHALLRQTEEVDCSFYRPLKAPLMNRVAIIYDRINFARIVLSPRLRSIWSRHIVADSQSIVRLFASFCRELHRLRYGRLLYSLKRESPREKERARGEGEERRKIEDK